MRPFLLSFVGALCLWSVQMHGQSVKNPNIWEGKVLFTDHYTPASDAEGGLDHIGVGLEAGYHRHISNLLTLGVPFKVAVADIPNVAAFDDRVRIISLDAVARFRAYKPENKFVPYLFAGVGGVFESINGETNDNVYPQAPVGLGLQYRIGPWGYLSAQGEYRISLDSEYERDNLQLGIGFTWQIGKGEPKEDKPDVLDAIVDSDEDGIPDKEDDCPSVAGLAAFKGCPDSDGDGIADGDDKCPEDAGLLQLMGCPDRDGDGVADAEDACPDQAGTLMGCPDFDNDGIANKDDDCPDIAGTLNGCPDRDSDGIADKDDLCPELAGVAANKGCPAQRDSDGDGVKDEMDACPSIAGPASNRGCPEIKQEEQDVLDFAMRAVRFETGSAKLKSESYAVLDQVASVLRSYPYYHVRINGHTDNVGSSNSNLRLSEERARACFEYLRGQGIDPLKLSYVGYGENRPVADNGTSEGRRLNRRVEFEMYID